MQVPGLWQAGAGQWPDKRFRAGGDLSAGPSPRCASAGKKRRALVRHTGLAEALGKTLGVLRIFERVPEGTGPDRDGIHEG